MQRYVGLCMTGCGDYEGPCIHAGEDSKPLYHMVHLWGVAI